MQIYPGRWRCATAQSAEIWTRWRFGQMAHIDRPGCCEGVGVDLRTLEVPWRDRDAEIIGHPFAGIAAGSIHTTSKV